MDWDKTIEEYKKLYYPKRKVNNKNSNGLTHIIGSYYSHKMKGQIAFESKNELDAFMLFELSSVVKGYFPQPEEVPVKVYDKNGELKPFKHNPDALALAEDSKPCLYQIKGDFAESELNPRNININRACIQFAREHGWDYKLVHTRNLSEDFRWNIMFIFPFLKKDRANSDYSNSILSYLSVHQSTTIDELANHGVQNVERQYVLPVIYHEIAKGTVYVDLSRRLDGNSQVRLAREEDVDFYQYIWELD